MTAVRIEDRLAASVRLVKAFARGDKDRAVLRRAFAASMDGA